MFASALTRNNDPIARPQNAWKSRDRTVAWTVARTVA
jgi:hypothetical protein